MNGQQLLNCFALGIALLSAPRAGAADKKPQADKDKVIKLTMIPAPKAGQPWIAATEKTAGEILGSGVPLPSLQVRVEGVKPNGASGATLAMVANTISLTSEVAKEVGFVDHLSFFPVDAKSHSFTVDVGEVIAKLDKAGELRRDRPLVFAFVMVPLREDGVFKAGDWSIDSITLRVGDR